LTRARGGHTDRTTCLQHPYHVPCGPSGGGLGRGRVLRRSVVDFVNIMLTKIHDPSNS
jgi:hypothetical protein